jgi:hypothetical protein
MDLVVFYYVQAVLNEIYEKTPHTNRTIKLVLKYHTAQAAIATIGTYYELKKCVRVLI